MQGAEGAGPGPVSNRTKSALDTTLMASLQWYGKLGLHINEVNGMTENLAVSHISETARLRT